MMSKVAGVEHGIVRHVIDGVAIGADVGVGTQQHAEVAVKGADFPDRLRALVLEAEPLIGPLNRGYWQERNQMDLHADGSRARTATTVRGGEGLVQVEV